MYAALDNLQPLPPVLFRDADGFGRRHRIGEFEIEEDALQLFNELLYRLGLKRGPIGRDQLASAARDLADQTNGALVAPSIHQRMRRAGAIDLMLRDANWTPEETVVSPAQLVVSYLRDERDLIPDTMPKVGRLDDAIVVDASWGTLAPEVRNYLDFCRLRQVEREMGNDGGGFDRHEWELARVAETRLAEHSRRVGGSSYVYGAADLRFHVC